MACRQIVVRFDVVGTESVHTRGVDCFTVTSILKGVCRAALVWQVVGMLLWALRFCGFVAGLLSPDFMCGL